MQNGTAYADAASSARHDQEAEAQAGHSAEAQPAWTIQRVLQWSIGYLTERAFSAPRLDAEILLAHALKCTRIQLYTHFDKPLTTAERDAFKALLLRRARGEPSAYLTGSKEFMGLTFAVDANVLIPRPDTEVLVEEAQRCLAAMREACQLAGVTHAPKILDIGTGSGCIAVSLAKTVPGAQVVAWDVEPAALAIATQNGQRHGLEDLRFERRDALDPASWEVGEAVADEARYAIIVSNPPYITPAEMEDVAAEVARHEPHRALVGGDDGLVFYRMFAEHAAGLLEPEGMLLVEIGATQASQVSELLLAAGWRELRTIKDYGRNDRVVCAKPPLKGTDVPGND